MKKRLKRQQKILIKLRISVLKKINKIDKSLARLRKKERKLQ